MTKIKQTERGWAGHFICAEECQFRRNTLLEYGEIRIVISTVGRMLERHGNKREFKPIGAFNRHYETMAFHAYLEDGKFWDANVSRQVSFDSEWALTDPDLELEANAMHEQVVREIREGLKKGKYTEGESDED